MSTQNNKLLVLIVLSLFFAFGCTDEKSEPESGSFEPQVLVSAEKIGEFSLEDINERASELSDLVSSFTRYGAEAYRITYKTTAPDGSEVIASGAMILPDTDGAFPLLSQHHGTITSESMAPSNYGEQSEAYSAGTLMASVGYVVSCPDYLGYGATSDMDHPYEHNASLAQACTDMLLAVREYCRQNNIELDNRLYLTGYSEGGYATMATHKKIEEEMSDEFSVTACAPGAGAYDKTRFMRMIVSTEDDLNFIQSYVWVLLTYDRIYGLNRPMDYYFQEPYASSLEGIRPDEGDIPNLPGKPQDLFQPSFLEAMQSNSDTELLKALNDNDNYDWKPEAKINLFHGTDDDYVPFFNSQNAYDAMSNQGADVTLTPIEGSDHTTAVPAFVLGVYFFFEGN